MGVWVCGCDNNEKSKRLKKSAAERLQSSMDEGMPAQAVANWVQCENPKCMKWRKLPWHVDVDLLPEKFFCSQNVWNPGYDNCDAPEDDWDMNDAPVKFNEIPLEEFKPGAKFDVMRNKRDYYTEGTVIEVDFSTEAKKVHFRFKGMTTKWNEWIEATSKKIAPHLSYVKVAPEKKAAVKSKKVDKKSPAPNDDDSKKVASKSKKAKRKHPAPDDGESPLSDSSELSGSSSRHGFNTFRVIRGLASACMVLRLLIASLRSHW